MEQIIWKCILQIRNTSPLVHNITNYVVMNNTANAVLAVGASPIMAHAHAEIDDMVAICQSVVINIGTLDEYWVSSMIQAAQKANQLQKPWILDPVGSGATPYRDTVLEQLLLLRPTVIRGNASEILALAKNNKATTKGVDSTVQSNEAVSAAHFLNQQFGSIVCISGETDIIVSDQQTICVHNGSTMMTKVTGLGCSASAVIGAYIAGIENKLDAVVAATSLFSISGEIAAKQAAGTGSLQVLLLDKLYNITQEEIQQHIRMEVKNAE
ncbi:MAG: hydroxyethylthiazole kinase [Tannerellaceae bacterium]|jgi:hydroxyethylthiazole kinase|nr:hydroxyethylthiazole kinase [Tannerellaceae bacterium]